MASPYIPPRDPELSTWLANFNARIAVAPATYGLTPADSVAINTAVAAFQTAYTAAINPSTRTPVTVSTKDTQKVATVALVRGYANTIQANLAVTNGAKADLGLTVRDTGRTPVPAPTTFPLLAVQFATPGQHVVRYADSETPDKRAKPPGALSMQLYRGVGVAVIADPAATSFLAPVTKQPYASSFNPADAGKIATYFARWVTRTGLVGPWSAGVSMTVAF